MAVSDLSGNPAGVGSLAGRCGDSRVPAGLRPPGDRGSARLGRAALAGQTPPDLFQCHPHAFSRVHQHALAVAAAELGLCLPACLPSPQPGGTGHHRATARRVCLLGLEAPGVVAQGRRYALVSSAGADAGCAATGVLVCRSYRPGEKPRSFFRPRSTG
ncbi:hypothetical protein FQZ97_1085490 [compost metagenome]